ncbi:type II toxin-antitoxin system VapC family toxin [Georgenia yuyongxinii]|uniref:Ribonuclease VapC n=1 Tax=Georgenia yuyongxinii TaxID=2589797 RepID=A0A552WYI8_9MICO|nr:type II toxin-antitoxin system VapC family toxin [Georgenia yuyongxinii]TRW47403.1 type II toxin-antitoxin system VapC family toxin [Georgenia yuyongxinii]
MRPRVVCDASAVVAVLLDAGPAGRWATDALTGADLAAPTLLPFEAANIIRRLDVAGLITADQAAQAQSDLLDLAIEQWPYELLAPRAWQLRQNLTAYDASYVALAELLSTAIVTLDRRISRAPGLRCTVATP